MKVTLDIFSGRENPSWYLDEKEAKSMLERVANKAVLSDADHQGQLGFSGFKIETTSDEQLPDGIQESFYIGKDLAEGFDATKSKRPLLSRAESGEVFNYLLSKANGAVEEKVLEYLKGDIQQHEKGIQKATEAEPEEDKELQNIIAKAPCIIANTAYNPAYWNTPATQPKNNCYNYAMNFRSNTFAQPGRKTGHMYTAFTCANVGNAATSDGCKTTCNGSSKLVALVIWPGVDFHWYRRHSNGFWGHKPGSTAARNWDNSNKIINGTTLTPANCNRGAYTAFCGYRFSPTGMQVS